MRVTRLATLDAAVAAVRAGAHDAALALLDVLRAQLVERPGEPEAATSDARRALRVVK